MTVTININGLTLCHKGSDGYVKNTLPDLCKTPPEGKPLPYDIVSYSKDLAKGTKSISADGGHMCANLGSEFYCCYGDEAGSLLGVTSNTHLAEATWMTYSPDVFLEGKPACRLTDQMWMNHANTVSMGGLVQIRLYVTNPKLNLLCNVFCDTKARRDKVKKAQQDLDKNPKNKDAREVIGKAKKEGLISKTDAFLADKHADQLANGKYADELAKTGLKSQHNVLTKISGKTKEALERIAKEKGKPLNKIRALMDAGKAGKYAEGQLNKALTKLLATKAGKKAATVWLKAIPIVNVLSTAYDIYDIGSTILDIRKQINAVKNLPAGDYVRITPDFAHVGSDGKFKGIYDMKFKGDRYRLGQKEIYRDALGGEKRPQEVDFASCNQCKSNGVQEKMPDFAG